MSKDDVSDCIYDYYVTRRGQPYTSTAFGELPIAEYTPYIQGKPVYNLIPANFREFTAVSGTTGAENRMFKVTTGTSQFGYGAIQSFRAMNYKAGEGAMVRFTALFETSVADSTQGAGLVNLGDELSFGYDGTTFGVWHRYGGLAEVRTITVTGGAGGGENLTLELNDVEYTIPLTAGTVNHNAYEIAQWLNDNQTVWGADQLDDGVIIYAKSDGAKSGAYNFTSGTATGTIAQNTAGVTKTSTHIAQADWNRKNFSDLDPTKGNVYQIKYQYLGFGNISYYVENPHNGEFELVHEIEYANANTRPSLDNPSLHFGIYAASLGSTGTDLVVRSGSCAGFVEGKRTKTRNPRSFTNTQSITTANETTVLALRNRRTYNSFINQVEIDPLIVDVANETSRNAIVRVRASTNPSVEQDYQLAGSNLVGDADTTASNFSGGRVLAAKSLPPSGEVSINLQELAVAMPPTLHLFVTVERVATGGSNTDFVGTITWYEDI